LPSTPTPPSAAAPQSEPGPCPKQDALSEFLSGQSSSEEREIIASHLGNCAACQELFIALGRTAPPDEERVSKQGPTALTQLAEFQLIRLLGQGAMGQVFLARDTFLDRIVALKLLLTTESTASVRDRFYTEARAVARLQHPNVVTLYRAGETDGKLYLVSEYVTGKSLDREKHPMPWQRVLQLGLGIARGLAAAHQSKVLHRDIKPANVMCTDDGQIKLLDFGLAKLVGVQAEGGTEEPSRGSGTNEDSSIPASPAPTSMTRTGALIGTPLYMAPECWESKPATTRSDVYSTGVMLHELCSGKTPHTGTSVVSLGLRVMKEDAAPLLSVAPSVDPELAQIIDRCVARDPAQRFASGIELCDALERLAKRTSRASRKLVSASAVLGLLLITIVGGLTWRGQRSLRTKLEAQQLAQKTQEQQSARERERTDKVRQLDLGLQAASLAQKPGKERDALTAAIQAVGMSLDKGESPPPQATAGMSAALSSTPHLLPLRHLPMFDSSVSSVSFSKDGSMVLVAAGDGVHLWEVQTGRELLSLQGHESQVTAALFIQDDAKLLTTTSHNLRLWDAQTGRLLSSTEMPGDVLPRKPLAQDHKRLLTLALRGHAVRIWSLENGVLLKTLSGHAADVLDTQFSPDGTEIVTASRDGTVRLWDGKSGAPRRILLRQSERVYQASYVDGGRALITVQKDGIAHRIDAHREHIQWSLGSKAPRVSCFDFSAQGGLVLMQSAQAGLQLYDGTTGAPLAKLANSEHSTFGARFSEDGRYIVELGNPSLIRIWSTQSGAHVATLQANGLRLPSIRFSAASRLITAFSAGLTLWNLQTLDPATLAAKPQTLAPTEQELTGEPLIATLARLAGQEGAEVRSQHGALRGILAADQRHLITISDWVALWDVATGRRLANLGAASLLLSVHFSANSQRLILVSETHPPTVYDVGTGQAIVKLTDQSDAVFSASFSLDSRQVLTAGRKRVARLWDVQSGLVSHTFYSPAEGLREARFSADGAQVLLTGDSGALTAHSLSIVAQLKQACALLSAGLDNESVQRYCNSQHSREQQGSALLRNADFVKSAIGVTPTDWQLPRYAEQKGYHAVRAQDCGAGIQSCIRLTGQGETRGQSGSLLQTVDATYLRGQRIRLRGKVRITAAAQPGASYATLRITCHTADGRSSSLFDFHPQPVTQPDWQELALYGDVPKDAVSLQLALVLHGSGQAWLADASLQTVAVSDETNPWLATPSNLSMEELSANGLPRLWSTGDGEEERWYQFTVSTEHARTGLRAACLARESGSESRDGTLSQTFDARPYRGKYIQVRSAARGALRSLGAAAGIVVDAGHDGSGMDSKAQYRRVTDTWQELQTHMDVPSDASTLSVSLVLSGLGMACFDDVRIEVVEPVPASTAKTLAGRSLPNLDLEAGDVGLLPDSWYTLDNSRALGYRAYLSDVNPKQGKHCGCLRAEKLQSPGYLGLLGYQGTAAQYRGRRIRARAALRAQVENDTGSAPPQNFANLYLLVIDEAGQMVFFDNMSGRPITSSTWQEYELSATVPPDASIVGLGLQLQGMGEACLDDIRVEVIDP